MTQLDVLDLFHACYQEEWNRVGGEEWDKCKINHDRLIRNFKKKFEQQIASASKIEEIKLI